MPKHPFLHNPHIRKVQLDQMCQAHRERFETLYHYYIVARKGNYSPETVFVMLEQIDAILTLLEKQEKLLENQPSNSKL